MAGQFTLASKAARCLHQGEIEFSIECQLAELQYFPWAHLRQDLAEVICALGNEYHGSYRVLVGDTCTGKVPDGISWKPYRDGQHGVGFYYGSLTEDDVVYEARSFAIVPPDTITVRELAEAVTKIEVDTTSTIAPFPMNAAAFINNIQTMRAFMTACADEMHRRSRSVLFPNEIQRVIQDLFTDQVDVTPPKFQSLTNALVNHSYLSRQAKNPNSRYQGPLFQFAPKAVEYLPPDKAGLAPKHVVIESDAEDEEIQKLLRDLSSQLKESHDTIKSLQAENRELRDVVEQQSVVMEQLQQKLTEALQNTHNTVTSRAQALIDRFTTDKKS